MRPTSGLSPDHSPPRKQGVDDPCLRGGLWLCFAFMLLFPSSLWADPPALTVKAVSESPPDDLAEPVRVLLGKEAFTVAEKDGDAVLMVWFRTTIPAKATAEQIKNGLTYREIPEGEILGAVKFAKTFIDYRKQEIAAGTYTLRFGVQPDVGDHMGTTPHPEFALLSPAAKDKTAEALDLKTLIKQSSGATNGDHPGVMLLFPHAAKDDGPKLADKEDGVKVLLVRRAVDADGTKTALGFALTVAGYSKARK